MVKSACWSRYIEIQFLNNRGALAVLPEIHTIDLWRLLVCCKAWYSNFATLPPCQVGSLSKKCTAEIKTSRYRHSCKLSAEFSRAQPLCILSVGNMQRALILLAKVNLNL